jgi:diguanylate cyclase (GGDEF)-like protein
MVQGAGTASWLCRDDAERERFVDMERRLRPIRRISFGLEVLALAASAFWIGWWWTIPLAVGVVGFLLVDRLIDRVRRPEWPVAAAWLLTELMFAVVVLLTGGPTSPALGWLAIPVVTLSTRFNVRGVAAGLVVSMVLLLAVTIGVDPNAVIDSPPRAVLPLALLVIVALLTTALMHSEVEHRSESVLDGLTGMLNRRSLGARVRELSEQARLTGEPVGVVVCDIDHFKTVNDEHGHTVGDAVLVDVAYTLRKELRAFDLAYRLGGEEFLVLLPGADLEQSIAVAERLRSAVERIPSGGLSVTLSFGAVSSGGGAFDYAQLFAAADAALYDAKRSGRNRVGVAGAGTPALALAAVAATG